MKNLYLLIVLLATSQLCYSQFYTSSGSEVFISADDFLFSNEPIDNNGTITLKNNSSLIIDSDLVNNNQIVYQNGSDKATLQIGSGEPTSNQPQDIQFNPNSTEEAPFIVLNKLSGTATVTRGHMRLLETFVSESGTLEANSSINPADAATDPGRVYGLTFANPDMTNVAQVDVSSGGDVRNVLIERFIPAGDNTKRAYRFLTSSVNSAGSINANWQEGVIVTSSSVPVDPNPGYGIHITGGSVADGFDQSGAGNPSMFIFDNTNANGTPDQIDDWSSLPNTNNKQLKVGEAYLTFVRGDRSVDISINNPTPTNTILRAIGDLHIGTKSFSSVNNSTNPEYGLNDQALLYSFVGNPYQATVDFRNITLNNVNSFYHWVWDPNVGVRGNYVTLDFTNIDPNVVTNSNINSQANQYIQPGQSFLVQTIANGPASITFDENDKDVSADATVVFSTQSSPSISLLFYTTSAFNSGNRESDGLVIKFKENANNNVDIMDADKFFGSDENLARLNGGKYISIENRNLPTDAEVLPLSTTGYTEDNYTFIANAENMQGDFEAFLLDNYTGTQTQLNEGATQVNYTIDANIPESIASDRFSIIFDNTTLGVDENTFGAGFNLYPNPTKDGYFGIKTPNLSGEVKVKLNNMLGQIVLNETLTIVGNEVNVNASGLSTGVYIVKLSQDEQTFSTKLIVE